MVIGVEPPAERVEQPQEGNRQRNQRPGEFIGVRLHLVEHQAGIGLRLGDAMVDEGDSRLDPGALEASLVARLVRARGGVVVEQARSEENTVEIQSLMRIQYA